MEYTEIFKNGFRVANKNLLAVLVQFLFSIAMTVMMLAMVLTVAAVFVGTMAGVSLTTLKPEDLASLLRAPVSALLAGAVMFLIFIVLAFVFTAFVQSGITGCLIDTKRGKTPGFSLKGFFSHAISSTFSMFRLQMLLVSIAVGTLIAYSLVTVIGFAVIVPLKDSGHQLAAFGAGAILIAVLLFSGLALLLVYISGNFIAQAALVDKRSGAVSALAEAYRFIKCRFWDIMVFTIMVLVAVFIILLVIALLFGGFQKEPSFMKSLVHNLKPLGMLKTIISLYVFLLVRACYVVCYIPQAHVEGITGFSTNITGTAGADDEPIEAELIEPDETADNKTLTFDFNRDDKDPGDPPHSAS
jgi:hypothetical protein